MRQFHRLKYSIDDHCGPEPTAEAQEEDAATLVAFEGLHGSIIDNFDSTESFAKVKSNPAIAQVVGLVERASMDRRPCQSDHRASG
jgi:hypothetical protein